MCVMEGILGGVPYSLVSVGLRSVHYNGLESLRMLVLPLRLLKMINFVVLVVSAVKNILAPYRISFGIFSED
jgi:hypothetical protein